MAGFGHLARNIRRDSDVTIHTRTFFHRARTRIVPDRKRVGSKRSQVSR